MRGNAGPVDVLSGAGEVGDRAGATLRPGFGDGGHGLGLVRVSVGKPNTHVDEVARVEALGLRGIVVVSRVFEFLVGVHVLADDDGTEMGRGRGNALGVFAGGGATDLTDVWGTSPGPAGNGMSYSTRSA